jgi:hypothetical protein
VDSWNKVDKYHTHVWKNLIIPRRSGVSQQEDANVFNFAVVRYPPIFLDHDCGSPMDIMFHAMKWSPFK